jgi:hypothetical protein
VRFIDKAHANKQEQTTHKNFFALSLIIAGEIKDIQLILPAEVRALWGPEDVKTWV